MSLLRVWGFAALCTLPLVTACKPPAFASQQADLLRQPPLSLPTDANAFWNDPHSGVYGEITVSPSSYRYEDSVCRAARVTAIDAANGSNQDRTVLYCATPGGGFRRSPSLSCRVVANDPGVTCRTASGDNVYLPPM